MCSIDSGVWCWDATTQAASDAARSQRWGWRGLLSFSFEVGVRQGRVTLPWKCLRGVRAANSSFPLRSVLPEYSMSIIHFLYLFRALHRTGKNHPRSLVHRWKTDLMSLDLSRARHLRVLSMKSLHLFLRILHPCRGFPSIFIFGPAFPFHKIPKLFHQLILASNLSRVRNDLALNDPSHLVLQISLDVLGISG